MHGRACRRFTAGVVSRTFELFILALFLFSALRLLPGDGLRLSYPSTSCPVTAVDFLRSEKIHGRLLVPFNYGSYALWQLRGQMRVSMDGRYDLVYRPETYQRVEDFFFARGDWTSLLGNPQPDAILLPKERSRLSQAESAGRLARGIRR